MLKKVLKKLDWAYDYYILYFMYNERKIDRYYQYMESKWGKQ